MKTSTRSVTRASAAGLAAAALVFSLGWGAPSGASAGEADAKSLLKAMSDYLAAQEALSFAYDATLEIATTEHQILALASSGKAILNRPDKMRATRSGGFADIEMIFDAKTLTLVGKNANVYTQIAIPGTTDHLIDELQGTYNRPFPAADLLVTDVYDRLMSGVVDIKDLGSGVIGGAQCDHLAFRTDHVDWQIWIAQGDRPHPCRYVITSKHVPDGPQYSIQIRDWKTGEEVARDDFSFKNSTGAKKMDLQDIREMNDIPENYVIEGAK